MNKSEFIRLIDKNTHIDSSILAELNELVNVFPYFQTAHLLLLKGLKENSDVRFESQLRNSAIHVADREVLFNLLNVSNEDRSAIRAEEIRGFETGPAREAEVVPVKEIQAEPVAEPVQEISSETATEPVRAESIASIPEPVQEVSLEPVPGPVQEADIEPVAELVQEISTEPVPEPVQEVTTEPIPEPVQEISTEPVPEPFPEVSSEPVPEPVQVVTTESVPEPVQEPEPQPVPEAWGAEPQVQTEAAPGITHPPETGDLEQTVIESARNSEDLIVEIERISGETADEGAQDVTEQIFGRPILVATESDIYETEGTVFVIQDETIDVEDKIYYMDPGFSYSEGVEPHTEVVELHGDVVDPRGEEKVETLHEEVKPEEIPVTDAEIKPEELPKDQLKKTQADLIDKFIASNPRIEPRIEKGEVANEDLARPSVEVKGGFVTETLARIYVNQGYYSKAIEIYEKLSLKYPEKSAYFATQIEKIKEIIK